MVTLIDFDGRYLVTNNGEKTVLGQLYNVRVYEHKPTSSRIADVMLLWYKGFVEVKAGTPFHSMILVREGNKVSSVNYCGDIFDYDN